MQGMVAIKPEVEGHMGRLEARMAAVEVALGVQRKRVPETDKKAPLLRKGESTEKIKKPLASLLGLVRTPALLQRGHGTALDAAVLLHCIQLCALFEWMPPWDTRQQAAPTGLFGPWPL